MPKEMHGNRRLIDANALKIAFKCREMADIDLYGGCHIAECFQGYEANEIVDKMPTVDAVEVVHGKWEKANENMPIYRCSICKERNLFKNGNNVLSNFCPNCGADMKDNKLNLEDVFDCLYKFLVSSEQSDNRQQNHTNNKITFHFHLGF